MKILQGSPGFGLPMTEEEIILFLSTKQRNIYIGTLDEKNEPNIHPIWYFFDIENRKIYLETAKGSKKLQNMLNNNTIYFCIDEPFPPYKGVRGKAYIEKISEDIDFNLKISEKIMIKYLGDLKHPMAKVLLSNVKSGNSVIVKVSPLYYSTWDYGKR